jgi:hypothetical protein
MTMKKLSLVFPSFVAFVATVVAAGYGCTAATELPSTPPPKDTPECGCSWDASHTHIDAAPVIDVCEEPLGAFQCPATYDDALAEGCNAHQGTVEVQAAICGSFYRFTLAGAWSEQCFYDRTSRALVGAFYQDDVADIPCEGGMASSMAAGQIDRSCTPTVPQTVACDGLDAGTRGD